MEVCVARPSVWRCVGCFFVPFVGLAAYVNKAASVGISDVQSFLTSVASNGQNAISALLFFGCSLVWVLVTWPKALAALHTGDCANRAGQHRIWLYGQNVERSQIAAVELVPRLLDIQLQVHRTDGSVVARSIVLLSPKPGAILTALREQGL